MKKTIMSIMLMLAPGAFGAPTTATSHSPLQLVQNSEPNFWKDLKRPQKGQPYGTFFCPRFAFSVDYPAQLSPQAPPQNGDGRSFVDGKSRMVAYAQWNTDTESRTPSQLLKSEYEAQRQPTDSYERLGKDFFVRSGTTPDGIIYYRKAIFKQDRWVFLLLEYPTSQKAQFDPIVSHVVRSLRLSDVPL